ncbi:XRE family transcriptional regulator [Kutzneria chonburiensis]|uniref:XRE family transcriptional regulator n=1 Tax=Kutzneria chonburiensis TaxID=1483604 RepID=A0ABV6NA52_9PSEU|nr:XRE family transcriptional regulator [Kutzneria chonburiensis]
MTQGQLAEAFSAERSTSVPLISSWESTTSPKPPPTARLEQYARFFATVRSAEEGTFRLLTVDELNTAERLAYEELLDQLTTLRPELPGQRGAHLTAAPHSKGLWQFPDSYNIVIVCARLPRDLMHSMGSYTDPNDPDYVDLYTYADPDALIELFGHIRAVNSVSNVRFKTVDQLERDDYTAHLVLLGGVDWNRLTRELLERVDVPVEQITRPTTEEPSGFEVTDEHGPRMYSPTVRGGRLLEDVAHFYRGENPFNVARTVTICNGMYGRGTYGAVRALTDAKFRGRNDDYVRNQLDRHGVYSLLMRVQVVAGQVVTPDWTVAETRLHEWPEAAS